MYFHSRVFLMKTITFVIDILSGLSADIGCHRLWDQIIQRTSKREMQKIPYVNTVGKLLPVYIRLTRFECAHFMSDPDMEHWCVVKRIM